MQAPIKLSWAIAALALALASGVGVGRWATPSRRAHSSAQLTTAPAAATAPANAPGKPLEAKPIDANTRFAIPVTVSQPSLGPADAIVTIVEWCDLPDEACAALEPTLQALRAKYPDTLRLVFRHYGRPDHPGSGLAHQLLRAAHEQSGKFWEARELLLAHRGAFTRADAERYAQKIGLDWQRVEDSITKQTYASYITADRLFADMFHVQGVPALFVNGRALGLDPTPDRLDRLVDDEFMQASAMIARGVPKGDVYAELTRKGFWDPKAVLNKR